MGYRRADTLNTSASDRANLAGNPRYRGVVRKIRAVPPVPLAASLVIIAMFTAVLVRAERSVRHHIAESGLQPELENLLTIVEWTAGAVVVLIVFTFVIRLIVEELRRVTTRTARWPIFTALVILATAFAIAMVGLGRMPRRACGMVSEHRRMVVDRDRRLGGDGDHRVADGEGHGQGIFSVPDSRRPDRSAGDSRADLHIRLYLIDLLHARMGNRAHGGRDRVDLTMVHRTARSDIPGRRRVCRHCFRAFGTGPALWAFV